MMDLVIEAAVTALMQAVTTEVWVKARDRIARALRPQDPHGESATLDRLVEVEDVATRRGALQTHLTERLREHPGQVEELHRGTSEVEQILIAANLVEVNAKTVHVHGQQTSRPTEAVRLAVMHAGRAAHDLEEMEQDVAIAYLAAMPAEAAARRLALMSNAASLLSNMDDGVAASLIAVMPAPHPARLLSLIDADQGAAIMAAMPEEVALGRLGELTEADPGRAVVLLVEMKKMNRDLAAKLLAELDRPHPAELFSRMLPIHASELLVAMSRERAVWRIVEMPSEHAALVLSKMDRAVTAELLQSIVPSLCTDLVDRMNTSDGAEVLAKMSPAWARDRLAEMPPARAIEFLVALRPPRSLLKEIDHELAGRLLPAAVAALARRAEDAELVHSAQTYAEQIKADAEAQAHQILNRASTVDTTAVAIAPAVIAVTQRPEAETQAPPPSPSLGDRIIEDLRRHRDQTSIKIARRLHHDEPEVVRELNVLIGQGRVVERSIGRTGVASYRLA